MAVEIDDFGNFADVILKYFVIPYTATMRPPFTAIASALGLESSRVMMVPPWNTRS